MASYCISQSPVKLALSSQWGGVCWICVLVHSSVIKSTKTRSIHSGCTAVHSCSTAPIHPSCLLLLFYQCPVCTCTLLFNLISSLAMFCVDQSGGVGVGLGLAILWNLLFTPCSFVCWYRPVYKAFRSDSSFNFFVFFFVFFAQVVVSVIMTIGIPGWGFSGWIVSLAALNSSVAVGAIMMMNAVLFTAQSAMGVFLLKKVHSLYRQTDASFVKAQAEFATGVMSNQTVRSAATNAAASAAQGAFTAPR